MKILVVGVMLLGMLGSSHCRHHTYAESKAESENVYTWSGGFSAKGEVGVKYKDGLKFDKDGSFDWHTSSATVKKNVKQNTVGKDTSTVATGSRIITTTKPLNSYSYSQDNVNQFAYSGALPPNGVDSRPYGHDPNYHNRYGSYSKDGYLQLENRQQQTQDPGKVRVIPLQ